MTDSNIPPRHTRMPPEVQLMQIGTAFFGSAAVYVAAKLGIADLLASGPKSAKDLAAVTGTDEQSLYRTLRSIAGLGVFTELKARALPTRPCPTRSGQTLQTAHATS